VRREKDFIGEKELEADALYGIHSLRARENFPAEGRFHYEWYRAMAVAKQACYLSAESFFTEASKQYDLSRMNIRVVHPDRLAALSAAAEECGRQTLSTFHRTCGFRGCRHQHKHEHQ
jgi:aspartate ammonia-lyase